MVDLNKKRDFETDIDNEIMWEDKKSSNWWKVGLFVMICLFGFLVGITGGLYFGALGLVNILDSVAGIAGNVTINVNMDEQALVDYAYDKAMDINKLYNSSQLDFVQLDPNPNNNSYPIEQEIQEAFFSVDEETLRMLEEYNKANPIPKNGAETLSNFRIFEDL